MRTVSIVKGALIIGCFSFLFGCQKEIPAPGIDQQSFASQLKKAEPKRVSRAYHDSFDVDLMYKPDIAGGWTPADFDAPVWYPGTGAGNATHMGNATTYFNTHTLRVEGTVTVFHARVGKYYAAQVAQFGIQPEDEISAINTDGKGNSIWFKAGPGGFPTWHIPGTSLIAMQGQMFIVGGTGKFEGATGETEFYGQFDQASFNSTDKTFTEASIWQKGRIEY